jgi:general secretion pathway protein C
MQSNLNSVWAVRVVTLAVAAVAAASAAYWGLKVWNASQVSRAGTAAIASAPPLDPQALANALGGGTAALAQHTGSASVANTQYVLQGVVADTHSGGAALIAVDGKPAKAFRVGVVVDGGLVLQSVSGRRAALGPALDDATTLELELRLPEK